MKLGYLLVGLVAGAAGGAIAVALTTPITGSEARAKVIDSTSQVTESVKDKVGGYVKYSSEAMGKLEGGIEDKLDSITLKDEK